MSHPHLFQPLAIRGITTRNRVVISPMCQYSSEDGFANDWHLVHLGARAVGGAGIVFTEAAAVAADGRITPDDLGIWDDAHGEMLGRIAAMVRSQGAVAGIQLAHAGRKASTRRPWDGRGALGTDERGWAPIWGPSPLPFDEGSPTPQELDEAGIAGVTRAFAAAAARALTAGFEVIEIHGAHGYLLSSFLSPLANERTDDYGGGFANRTRLLREVVAAVREVWPERLPLFVRVSATDWEPGGWTPDETVDLANMLKPLGVDVLDCSSGGNTPKVSAPVGAGYQVPLAARVKHETGMLACAVGMITQAAQADQIVRTGLADLVAIARESLRDPQWPLRAARELGVDVAWPAPYRRAK